ncbi:hypothetical protein RB213_011309 [Colletotrichum asianum]
MLAALANLCSQATSSRIRYRVLVSNLANLSTI